MNQNETTKHEIKTQHCKKKLLTFLRVIIFDHWLGCNFDYKFNYLPNQIHFLSYCNDARSAPPSLCFTYRQSQAFHMFTRSTSGKCNPSLIWNLFQRIPYRHHSRNKAVPLAKSQKLKPLFFQKLL